MAQKVRCDVCGGLFSSSHLGSHKRLAHAKKRRPGTGSADKRPSVQEILALYDRLSPEDKKHVLDHLASLSPEAG